MAFINEYPILPDSYALMDGVIQEAELYIDPVENKIYLQQMKK
jgi:hypothetical protein